MCTLTVARYQPELEESTQRSTKIPGPLIIGQETSLDISLGSMSLIDHRGNFDPELSSPTSYSQHQYSTPGNRPFAYRKDLSGPDTPSSHGSYNHRYMGRNSDQISCWSPSFNSFSNFGLQSPVWSNYSPGTIGQERRVPSLPVNRQGYVQQQRGQGRASGRQHHEYGSGHHNVVDIDRIRLGTDVRTTVSLSSSPNLN